MAVVAIGGLVVDTFPTLLVAPVLFHVLESGRMRVVGCVTRGCDGRVSPCFSCSGFLSRPRAFAS